MEIHSSEPHKQPQVSTSPASAASSDSALTNPHQHLFRSTEVSSPLATRNIAVLTHTNRKPLPFSLACENPAIKAGIQEKLECLYEPGTLGSGEKACRFILDSFPRIVRPQQTTPPSISIAPITDTSDSHFTLGSYNPYENNGQLTLHPKALSEGGLEGTLIHEMTHALHYAYFYTATNHLEERAIEKEIGVSTEELTNSIIRAGNKLPSRHTITIPSELITRNPEAYLLMDMQYHFLPIKELVYKGLLPEAFAEFLARIPEMYYIYRSIPKEHIDKALQTIFPLGFQFFWGNFKETCEKRSLYPFTIDNSDLDQTTQQEIFPLFKELYEEIDPQNALILQSFNAMASKTENVYFSFFDLRGDYKIVLISPTLFIHPDLVRSKQNCKLAILSAMTGALFLNHFGIKRLTEEAFIKEHCKISKTELEEALQNFIQKLQMADSNPTNALAAQIKEHYSPLLNRPQLPKTFLEFLTLTSEVYFLYKDQPKEAIDAVLLDLFPVGYRFFHTQFIKALVGKQLIS